MVGSTTSLLPPMLAQRAHIRLCRSLVSIDPQDGTATLALAAALDQSRGMTHRLHRVGLSSMVPLWALVSLCCVVELGLTLADWDLWGPPRLRDTAYEAGAFWPGLLADWQPNYAAQPFIMFLTYSLLHGGLLHLAMNMVTLVSLGRAAVDRLGGLRFWVLYLGSAVGGAATFAYLSQAPVPMVGASGALFGLAGAILAWYWEDEPSLSIALRAVGRIVLLLIGINIAMYFALSGRLAWETHLGGFLAGWVLGIALDPGRLP